MIEAESKKRAEEMDRLKTELADLSKTVEESKREREAAEKKGRANELELRSKIYSETVKNGEELVKEALHLFEDPVLYKCKSSADYLLSKLHRFDDNLNEMMASYKRYGDDKDEDEANFFNLLRLVSHFSGVVSETVVSGKVTSIAAGDVEKGEQLAEASRQAGQVALELLADFGARRPGAEARSKVDETVKRIMKLLNDLLPKVHDISKEELGDLVDKEMQNTSQAIEAAVAKLEVFYYRDNSNFYYLLH